MSFWIVTSLLAVATVIVAVGLWYVVRRYGEQKRRET